jgi:hypothetical protein
MKITIVTVKFWESREQCFGSKEYSYLTDIPVIAGDIVVCEARELVGIAQVFQTSGLGLSKASKAYRWIVSKVDMAGMAERRDKAARYLELQLKLTAAKERIERERTWEVLAKDNPDVAELLAELKDLES